MLVVLKCQSTPMNCMALSGQGVMGNQTVGIVANGGSPANNPQLNTGL